MTTDKILQIIKEEVSYSRQPIFEGVISYDLVNRYKNNQLIEIYDTNGKQLITENVIDTVQGVLDWSGFIPGIGDFLDAVNAIIYFMRNKIFDGLFSLVAVIPVAGSIIAKPFKYLFSKIGKILTPIISKLTKNGKGAAQGIVGLIKKGHGKLIEPVFNVVKKYGSKINGFLDKIIPTFNNMVKKASFGYFSLPPAFVKGGDVIIKQIKEFFTELGNPKAYEVAKKKVEKEVHHKLSNNKNTELTDTELLKYQKAYRKADKKKYPTIEKFVIAVKKWEERQNPRI